MQGLRLLLLRHRGLRLPPTLQGRRRNDISPTQPFPTPKAVRFADTINADTPSNFNPNDENTGTAIPARSCRPAGTPWYNSNGLYIPHPDSVPFEPAEQDDQDPHTEDAQRPATSCSV